MIMLKDDFTIQKFLQTASRNLTYRTTYCINIKQHSTRSVKYVNKIHTHSTFLLCISPTILLSRHAKQPTTRSSLYSVDQLTWPVRPRVVRRVRSCEKSHQKIQANFFSLAWLLDKLNLNFSCISWVLTIVLYHCSYLITTRHRASTSMYSATR